ncbi:MAG: hypothetical protein AAFW89_14890 [Bacteroidota bacterium]
MLIGGDFNKKAKVLLSELSRLSEETVETKIAVSELVQLIQADRNEMRNLLEYLENKDCISVETIGGPYLYGHISITKKGLRKAVKK